MPCTLFLILEQNLYRVAAAVAVAGAGIGTLFPIATVSVQNAVERANLGIVTGALGAPDEFAKHLCRSNLAVGQA